MSKRTTKGAPSRKTGRTRAASPASASQSSALEAQSSFVVPDFHIRPALEAQSNLLMVLGGLGEELDKGHDPLRLAAKVANSITAAVQDMSVQAEPMPANIMAMIRLSDYFFNTEGDVWQTVAIPGEVILKDIEIECDDKGAKKEWEALWHQEDENGRPLIDIDDCYREIYFGVEQYGQSFPLELWDSNQLKGFVFIEPTSMWVGRHFITTARGAQTPYAMIFPQNLKSFEELKSMVHPLMYTNFVTDLNIQTVPAHRIPIPTTELEPVFAHKQLYHRYAVPHISRASRRIFAREVLDEYQQGTIEGYLSQLWMFTVGTKEWPASPTKMRAIRAKLNDTAKNRTGVLVVDHAVSGEVLAPKTLDTILANDKHSELSQLIYRDLGFSVFWMSGELPGARGRGGGQQVDVDVQVAIERWKYRRKRFIRWAKIVSRKYAVRQKSEALLAHPPAFVVGAIQVEQTQIIKDKIIPMLSSGALDLHNSLKDSGYNYDQVLRNKQLEEKNGYLFIPRPSFNQTATRSGGGETESQSTPNAFGRPSGGTPRLNANALEGQTKDWRGEIDQEYRQFITGAITAAQFGEWLSAELTRRGVEEFQNGFMEWGGLGDPDYAELERAKQGLAFHLKHLKDFVGELQKLQSEDEKRKFRVRALAYAGAVHTLHMLGVQQAYRSHGAKGWQRELHPELSASGPCSECEADSLVTHSMDEPFWEPHPHGYCSARSVLFHFGENGDHHTTGVRVPDWGFPTSRMTR